MDNKVKRSESSVRWAALAAFGMNHGMARGPERDYALIPICQGEPAQDRSQPFRQTRVVDNLIAKYGPTTSPELLTEEPHPCSTQRLKRGSKGGEMLARRLSPKRRREIAKKAAEGRWRNPNITLLLAPHTRGLVC
jgi:hypothetical protein